MDVKNAASREGGVGKTQLIRALLGEPFRQGGSKTPGIDIRPVELEHPSEEAVTMRLNAWDFGGQEIYHATHQFFLTERSLFLLVWNARHGWEQGKLYYWLDTIQAKAPNSPVLIVAAHSDEHPPNLPILEIQRRYPQVLAHNEVSNLNGAGIRELREKLREVAAGLPLMGEIMPTSWLKAANAVRALSARSISPKRLFETMVQEGVTGDSARILAQWLHDQGELLYFQGDQELNDTVILEPEWVTSYIYRVLDNEAVIARSGVFRRDDMLEVWEELDASLQHHFIRLMERFDLSYRTLEDQDISIVAECLSLNPPGSLEADWEKVNQTRSSLKEVSMRFDVNTTMPAGIPTWFIARQHRFTTYRHWRYGALLADGGERKHLALVQAFPHDRYVQLDVRGPHPHNFFALLRDGLELTLARFAGLRIDRSVPCPGHDGQPCDYRFNYNRLLSAIQREEPILAIECQESFQ